MSDKYRRYDWVLVKEIFVEGLTDTDGQRQWPNLREVSSYHGVPYNRVRERAAKEHWTEQRAVFQAQVERSRQTKRADELATEAVQLDATALRLSKAGLGLLGARLADLVKQERSRAEDGQNADDPLARFMPQPPAVNAREIEQLSRAATAWHVLGGRALGEIPITRTELTGLGGAPVQVASVSTQLQADNPERLSETIEVLRRAGVFDLIEPPTVEPGSAV